VVKDLTGKRFDKLKVIKIAYKTPGRTYWLCKCDCGKELIKRSDSFNQKGFKSCRQCNKGYEHLKGLRNKYKKLYYVMYSMRSRCNNPNDKEYFRYGGRGISICKEWMDNENFINWALENGYKEGLSIERINVNGNYEPNNCKWIPISEQSNNTRRTVNITYNNETHNINQWSRILGFNKNSFYNWIKKGYSIEYIIKKKRGERE